MTCPQPEVDGLVTTVNALRSYLERNQALSKASDLGLTSPFWRQMFDARSNFPDLNGLIGFRRGNYGYGIGEERQGDESAERRHFERIACIMRHSVPDEFVVRIPEPLFGAPYVFGFGSRARSASFVVNAATAWHVAGQVRAQGLGGRPLDVCEIGPGWGGCAYQLHAELSIRSYTLVDLPENLLLSGIYLSCTRPERRLETVEVTGGPLGQAGDHVLRAALPRAVERLQCQFDLILNTFSLQEMEKATVDRYLAWILQRLAPEGIFISINSHGKAGVKLPRDYGLQRFEFRHLSRFREFPTGFFNTIPYAITLAARTVKTPEYSVEALDTLCALMQFGLGPELQGAADAYCAGELGASGRAWLAAFWQWLGAPECTGKLADARVAGKVGVADYLEAHTRLARGEPEQAVALLRSAASSLGGFALTRAAVIARIAGADWDLGESLDIVRAYPEVEPLLRNRDAGPFVRHFNAVTAPFASP